VESLSIICWIDHQCVDVFLRLSARLPVFFATEICDHRYFQFIYKVYFHTQKPGLSSFRKSPCDIAASFLHDWGVELPLVLEKDRNLEKTLDRNQS
tara:strand:- start:218 stop:505 length:288 start_codon:yes stop_codon:yes gene_type:complete